MALVVAPPPTLTAVAWQQSDDREATYDKLVAILSEAPSETCSLLSYEQDSEPEERLAAEAAGAPSRPTRPASLAPRCGICGTPAPRTRPGAAAPRARSRRPAASPARGPGSRQRCGALASASAGVAAALNCAGAALRYGDGAALAAALEIRARCGPGREPADYAGRWCGTQPDDDSHWDVALLNRLGAPCAEARALAADALAAFAPVVARARPLAAAVATGRCRPRSSRVADLARRGPRARARRLRRRGRAAVRGRRRGGLRRGGRGAKRAATRCPSSATAGAATGLVKILSKCKTAVQRYAAHDDTAPGDAAAAACLGSFFGAWAAVYACMR
ncbi:hypothetical protein SO694_00129086 [Aureococcus anophagefferens]|uniref:Uncharacterized protein n=1 Tax=Aureococcus anophagefferens TaxID=44056 RepID=A0ABR1G5B1_AURAN